MFFKRHCKGKKVSATVPMKRVIFTQLPQLSWQLLWDAARGTNDSSGNTLQSPDVCFCSREICDHIFQQKKTIKKKINQNPQVQTCKWSNFCRKVNVDFTAIASNVWFYLVIQKPHLTKQNASEKQICSGNHSALAAKVAGQVCLGPRGLLIPSCILSLSLLTFCTTLHLLLLHRVHNPSEICETGTDAHAAFTAKVSEQKILRDFHCQRKATELISHW